MTHKRYFYVLLLLFVPIAIWAAIKPLYPADWTLENVLVVVVLVGLIVMTVVALINIRLQRDFAQEWNESLSIHHSKPLGEDEIARMRDG